MSGPATRLADFAEECKEKKLRSFSSYKTQKDLSEVLEKYGRIGSELNPIMLQQDQQYSVIKSIKSMNYYKSFCLIYNFEMFIRVYIFLILKFVFLICMKYDYLA
jgi:hypothetical protein